MGQRGAGFQTAWDENSVTKVDPRKVRGMFKWSNFLKCCDIIRATMTNFVGKKIE